MLAPPLAVNRPLETVDDAVEMNPASVDSPDTFSVEESASVPAESTPMLPLVLKRLVELAVVEKRLVVVAFVPVAFTKTRSVVDAVTAFKLETYALVLVAFVVVALV